MGKKSTPGHNHAAALINEDFILLVQRLPGGIILHRDGIILFANTHAQTIFGVSAEESLSAEPLTSFFPPDSWKRLTQAMDASDTDLDEEGWPAEMKITRVDHKEIDLETISTAINLSSGPAICTTLKDVSQRKLSEKRIHHQANYDHLTGLPNRTLFRDRLVRELIRAKRLDSRVALMFIDLDRFKWVNDTLGHGAGDQLLKEVSVRLEQCLRKSDTIARIGGDEFTAILPDMARGPHAERVAGSILQALATPFVLEGQEAFISGSVGITVYPDDAEELEVLLKNADTAMYRAKNDGRNAFRFYTPDMHDEAQERMELEKDLHRALQRNELVIHYQPIIDLRNNIVVGAESFLRWEHPKRGSIPPNTFIPLAEEIGMIGEITAWTIRSACTFAQKWISSQQVAADFLISVNLSCTRCRDLSTDDKIEEILKESGLPPTSLVLEITENILSEDEQRAMVMLNHLTRLGVNLWLDDFGTGYSSLSVLKKLPVNGIKIDRAFVPDVTKDPETTVLVEAIMSLAKSLKRRVIGEGVERVDQAEFLIHHGCIWGQGYLYSKAVTAEEFEEYLSTTKITNRSS
ncbi:MAG: EAL domain-containing protein [Magnetococcales bacterium]|nr:EAL domain-containing protein [Magnetococcales bacterium]